MGRLLCSAAMEFFKLRSCAPRLQIFAASSLLQGTLFSFLPLPDRPRTRACINFPLSMKSFAWVMISIKGNRVSKSPPLFPHALLLGNVFALSALLQPTTFFRSLSLQSSFPSSFPREFCLFYPRLPPLVKTSRSFLGFLFSVAASCPFTFPTDCSLTLFTKFSTVQKSPL